MIPSVPGIPEATDHPCRSLCESCHTSAVSLCPTELRKSHQDKARKDKAEGFCGSFECEFPSLLTKQEQSPHRFALPKFLHALQTPGRAGIPAG